MEHIDVEKNWVLCLKSSKASSDWISADSRLLNHDAGEACFGFHLTKTCLFFYRKYTDEPSFVDFYQTGGRSAKTKWPNPRNNLLCNLPRHFYSHRMCGISLLYIHRMYGILVIHKKPDVCSLALPFADNISQTKTEGLRDENMQVWSSSESVMCLISKSSSLCRNKSFLPTYTKSNWTTYYQNDTSHIVLWLFVR